MEDSKIKEFLNRIAQIESNGGRNINHKVITSGIQKGDSAIGTYGLMPKTIDEIADRSGDPELKKLKDMTADEKRDYIIKNPLVESQLATTLAKHVLDREKGNEEMASYAWNQGHNLTPEQIAKRDYLSSDYVQKYDKLAGQQPSNKPPVLPLNVQGTPSGDKVIASLGGMGSDPTLALNASQKDELQSYLAARKPAAIEEIATAAKPIAEALTTPMEQPTQKLQPLDVPVMPASPPKFNSINELIAKYNALGRK
jgi:hypothetical protein